MNEISVPPVEETHTDTPSAFKNNPPKTPSPKRQSWGAIIAIIIILAIVCVGAYYAWNKRAGQQYPAAQRA